MVTVRKKRSNNTQTSSSDFVLAPHMIDAIEMLWLVSPPMNRRGG